MGRSCYDHTAAHVRTPAAPTDEQKGVSEAEPTGISFTIRKPSCPVVEIDAGWFLGNAQFFHSNPTYNLTSLETTGQDDPSASCDSDLSPQGSAASWGGL